MEVNRKILSVLLIGALLIGCVGYSSAYYCIQEEDNEGVKEFKSNINILGFENDIQEHQLTSEAFKLKLKYFSDCD